MKRENSRRTNLTSVFCHLTSGHDAGQPITRTEYLPYGETWFMEGDKNYAPKFNSQQLDKESNLYFMNARHYDPELARFVSADSIVDGEDSVKGWNRYMYVGGNPVMYKDPSGHEGNSVSPTGEPPGEAANKPQVDASDPNAADVEKNNVEEKMQAPISGGIKVRGVTAKHTGLDIAAERGTPIKATVSGKVVYQTEFSKNIWQGGDTCPLAKGCYGNTVYIQDAEGNVHRYGHMRDAPNFKIGEEIKAGQEIGKVGNTGNSEGPHLHYDIYVPKDKSNPEQSKPAKYLDPAKFYKEKTGRDIWEDMKVNKNANQDSSKKKKD